MRTQWNVCEYECTICWWWSVAMWYVLCYGRPTPTGPSGLPDIGDDVSGRVRGNWVSCCCEASLSIFDYDSAISVHELFPFSEASCHANCSNRRWKTFRDWLMFNVCGQCPRNERVAQANMSSTLTNTQTRANHKVVHCSIWCFCHSSAVRIAYSTAFLLLFYLRSHLKKTSQCFFNINIFLV